MPNSQLKEPQERLSKDNGQPTAMIHPVALAELSRFANENKDKIRSETAKNLEAGENETNTDTKSDDTVSDKESNGNIINNVKGRPDDSSNIGSKSKVQNLLKEKGPIASIIVALGAGGIIAGSLLSPAFLLNMIRATIVDSLSTVTTSLQIRSNKILISKTTSGACTGIRVVCRYSSMTEKQLGRFKDAGITVNYGETTVTTTATTFDKDGKQIGEPATTTETVDFDGSHTGGTVNDAIDGVDGSIIKREITTEIATNDGMFGRYKPSSFVYNGKKILAKDFATTIASDPGFRAALRRGYNPLFAGFADKYWHKVLFTLKIDENGVKITGGDAKEKTKSVQEATKGNRLNVEGDVNANEPSRANYPDGEVGDTQFTKDLADYSKVIEETDVNKAALEISEAADATISSGTKTANKLSKLVTSVSGATATEIADGAKSAASVLKITGVVDNVCMVYGSTRALGYASKTVRAVQLAAFAMLILTLADQITAGGNPDQADVDYIASTLTTPSSSGKSATDGAAYKYDAYGETVPMSNDENQFLAGAGLAGGLIVITQIINNVLGKSPNTVCKITNNIFVQIGSFVVGIAAAALTDGASIEVATLAKAALFGTVAVAIVMLPALLADIVAGVAVDDSTVGDLAYAALHTGAATPLNLSAALGGNTVLNPGEAAAYSGLTSQVAEAQAEEDRLAYSPLDASNKNTFMGKIASYVTPFIANVSSFVGALGSVSSFTTGSLAYLTSSQYASAASVDKYNQCSDLDYQNMNLAADPYCNLIYGVPADALENIEPATVLQTLAGSGDIDGDTGNIISKSSGNKDNGGQLSLSEYDTQCINRTQPYGYTGDNFQDSDGSECLVNDSHSKNVYYSLYFIDKRAEDGMSGDDNDLNVAMDAGLNASIAFYNGSNGINQSNVASSSSIFNKIDEFFSNNNTGSTSSSPKTTATFGTNNLKCSLDTTNTNCDYSSFGFYKDQEFNL